MSVFSSQTSWPAGCSTAAQSPINLSQSSAKPCNITCDLVMDDGYPQSAQVSITDEGLLVTSQNLGSCKFRGESYACQVLQVNHPSHHQLEGIQADAEVIAYFQKPTGELLCVSSLIRVNPTQSLSYNFFKGFIPYANPDSSTSLVLKDWSLFQMIPSGSAYFTYAGTNITPPCMPCEWVVFKQMINMDQTDFAFLVRNVSPGSRSIQAVGDREIFFNDTQNLPGGPMPHDNKTYMRCRPTGAKKAMRPITKVDLKTTEQKEREKNAEEERNPTTTLGQTRRAINEYVAVNGYIGGLDAVLFVIACVIGAYYGYTMGNSNSAFSLPRLVETAARFIRGIFIKKQVTPVI